MTTTTKPDTTFLKITNKDIYKEIVDIKDAVKTSHELSDEKFNSIIRRLDVTNGKVKRSLWVATTAITLIMMLFGLFFQHLIK